MGERGNLDLAIARIPFLKASERFLLAESLDRERELVLLSSADLERMVGRSLAGKEWRPDVLLDEAAQDRSLSERRGIGFVSCMSSRYPPLLRELCDPPTVLFFRGTLPDPEKPMAAVVGTREPSGEALAESYRFGLGFGSRGVPVVSGLARGIDAMAHRGNLDARSPTIAVLGSGLDEVYPRSNRALARRIIETGGALVGEYPPGTPPYKWNFPARNRIIAGLARATVVVEAPASSGALITADFAVEDGRDLWVGGAGVASRRGEGTRALAASGAPVASSADDVLADWGIAPPPHSSARFAYAAPPPAGRRAGGSAAAEALARSLEIELQ